MSFSPDFSSCNIDANAPLHKRFQVLVSSQPAFGVVLSPVRWAAPDWGQSRHHKFTCTVTINLKKRKCPILQPVQLICHEHASMGDIMYL